MIDFQLSPEEIQSRVEDDLNFTPKSDALMYRIILLKKARLPDRIIVETLVSTYEWYQEQSDSESTGVSGIRVISYPDKYIKDSWE